MLGTREKVIKATYNCVLWKPDSVLLKNTLEDATILPHTTWTLYYRPAKKHVSTNP